MTAGGAGREEPASSLDTEFFWTGIAAGELRVQRCSACSVLRHPPRPVCAACGDRAWDWVVSAGHGELYSYTVVHHPPVPGRAMPHAVALVDLDDGVRVLAPLLDAEPAALSIGSRVEAVFPVDGTGRFLAVQPRATP